jgi:hypothetical protein
MTPPTSQSPNVPLQIIHAIVNVLVSSEDFQKLTARVSMLRDFAERRRRDDKSSENPALWMVSGTLHNGSHRHRMRSFAA